VSTAAAFEVARDGRRLTVSLRGDWELAKERPDTASLGSAVQQGDELRFDCAGLGEWDSALVALIVKLHGTAEAVGGAFVEEGLPDGVIRLLTLAFAVPEREDARRHRGRAPLLERLGTAAVRRVERARAVATFVGETTFSLVRFVTGRANLQRADLWVHLQEAGAEALGIVTLIAFLIGVILAFVAVVQLQKFGAGIYVADLVAIGVVREMGPIMTGVIMAGRTGAAYAASLGTMKVNEEIDALSTVGVDPIDFLVLPRVLALVLMMPLLALYADLMGVLGGATVALSMLDVTLSQYFVQTFASVDLVDLFGGLAKAVVYGILVALAGCLRGMECGDSAAAVGLATTSAVVTGIVLIVASCGVLTVIYTNLGI